MSGELFDPGLQPERTGLAWHRTALALGVGALLYARIQAQPLGGWAWMVAISGLVTAGLLGLGGRLRYRAWLCALGPEPGPTPDGLLPAALSLAVGLGGLVATVLMLV